MINDGSLKTTYLGNSRIKRDGVQEEWTPEKLIEYKRCSDNPVYFIKKYMKVVHLDRGLVNFELYPYQEKMINHFVQNRFSIVLSCRQSGKTVSVLAYVLWYALFNSDKTIFLLANKGDTARSVLFARLTLALENIPFFLQPGTKVLNRATVEFSNNTKVMARATSSSSIRGESANLVICDEFGFLDNADEFYTSTFPVISSGKSSQVVIVSTANGVGNVFHRLWTGAIQGTNDYQPFTINWWDVPGRDEKWKEETVRNTSREQFDQEFANSFIGSSKTLINGNTLLTLKAEIPIHVLEDDSLSVYKKPVEGHQYILIVDVARGRGKDYSTFSIIDVTAKKNDDTDDRSVFEQVCVYRNNLISPLIFPSIINKYGRMYNNAYCIVESNDNGQIVANSLFFDFEYEELFSERRGGRLNHGLETNKKVKAIGCSHLKDLVEKESLIIRDKETIKELTMFVETGASFAAEQGNHDDLVMTLVLFAWFTNQMFFEQYTDISVRDELYRQEIEQIENELLPFGVIDDNTGDLSEVVTYSDENNKVRSEMWIPL